MRWLGVVGDRFPLLAALAASGDGPLAAEAAAAIERFPVEQILHDHDGPIDVCLNCKDLV